MLSRRISYQIVLYAVLGALVTGATYFVSEGVLAPLANGGGGSASALGFPLPYFTFFGCCIAYGPPPTLLDNTYFFHPLGFLVDVLIWTAISFAVVSALTFRKLMIALSAGFGATLLSLLSPPLSLVAPTPGLETDVLTPMGFPYEYFTYYVTGLPGVSPSSGYEFSLLPAVADFALWFGIAFLVMILMSLIAEKSTHLLGKTRSQSMDNTDNRTGIDQK